MSFESEKTSCGLAPNNFDVIDVLLQIAEKHVVIPMHLKAILPDAPIQRFHLRALPENACKPF